MENIKIVKNQNQRVFCKNSSNFAHTLKIYNFTKNRAKRIFSKFQAHNLAGLSTGFHKNYFSATNALLLENLIMIIKFYFLHFQANFVAKNIFQDSF